MGIFEDRVLVVVVESAIQGIEIGPGGYRQYESPCPLAARRRLVHGVATPSSRSRLREPRYPDSRELTAR